MIKTIRTSLKMDIRKLKNLIKEEQELYNITLKLKPQQIKDSGKIRVSGKIWDNGKIKVNGKIRVSGKIKDCSRIRYSSNIMDSIKIRVSGKQLNKAPINIKELQIMEQEHHLMEDNKEVIQPLCMINQELLQKMFTKDKWFLKLKDKRD